MGRRKHRLVPVGLLWTLILGTSGATFSAFADKTGAKSKPLHRLLGRETYSQIMRSSVYDNNSYFKPGYGFLMQFMHLPHAYTTPSTVKETRQVKVTGAVVGFHGLGLEPWKGHQFGGYTVLYGQDDNDREICDDADERCKEVEYADAFNIEHGLSYVFLQRIHLSLGHARLSQKQAAPQTLYKDKGIWKTEKPVEKEYDFFRIHCAARMGQHTVEAWSVGSDFKDFEQTIIWSSAFSSSYSDVRKIIFNGSYHNRPYLDHTAYGSHSLAAAVQDVGVFTEEISVGFDLEYSTASNLLGNIAGVFRFGPVVKKSNLNEGSFRIVTGLSRVALVTAGRGIRYVFGFLGGLELTGLAVKLRRFRDEQLGMRMGVYVETNRWETVRTAPHFAGKPEVHFHMAVAKAFM